MPTLEQLERIAVLLAQADRQIFPGSSVLMKDEGGYRYQSFESDAAAAIMERVFGQKDTVADLELDYVEVYSGIRPHQHLLTDAVLVCRQVPAGTEAYFQLDSAQPPAWHAITEGQALRLPRGAIHGFRLDPRTRVTLQLVGVNYPPIAEDDVVYK